MSLTLAIGLIVVSYLCGAIPFGLLVGRLKGVDIRAHGSGNIGATNAGRVLGRPYGYLVFALDLLKGLLPVLSAGVLVRHLLSEGYPPAMTYLLWVGVAAAAVLGHMFPVFLRFKGGKGVATSVGALLGTYPFFTLPAVGGLIVWVILTLATRYVSVGSVGGAISIPLFFNLMVHLKGGAWRFSDVWPFHVLCIAMAILVIGRHRGNIRRLLAGTESRIGRRPIQESVSRSTP